MGRRHPIRLNDLFFASKKDATQYIRDVLNSTQMGETVDDYDVHQRLLSLLARHPDFDEKSGCGVANFMVSEAPEGGFGSRCFYVQRKDGTCTDFSYRRCIAGESRALQQEYLDAARWAVRPSITEFRERTLRGGQSCLYTGEILTPENSHADHRPPWLFKSIAMAFLEKFSLTPSHEWISTGGDNTCRARFIHDDVEAEFIAFHDERADLELIYWRQNMSFGSKIDRTQAHDLA